MLNGSIFRVGWLAKVSISHSAKRWQVPRENVLHFPSFLFEEVDV